MRQCSCICLSPIDTTGQQHSVLASAGRCAERAASTILDGPASAAASPAQRPGSGFSDLRSPPLEGLDSHSDRFQLEAFNRARASGGGGGAKMGRFLSFGRSPKVSAGAELPATPESLQLDELLLFSEDSLPVSLLKHNPDNASRAVKMFQSVLQYMGVHGEMLGAMAALELAQKLLHQGLKRVELRDELYMQLVKQTRGNPNPAARTKAWQLFYLTAATMPPTKDFMGLVSGGWAGRDAGSEWVAWAGMRQWTARSSWECERSLGPAASCKQVRAV